MRLTKYDPTNAFDKLFDNLGWGLVPRRLFEEELGGEDEGFRVPRTNIHETEKDYVFTMEMPGISKKDVNVSIDGDRLLVTAENVQRTESDKGVLRREIRSQRYERSFTLGGNIDRETIKATMEDGVLTVTLPKKAEKVGRKITVA